MFRVTANVLVAFSLQAHANYVGNMPNSVDNLVDNVLDKFFDRALKAVSRHRAGFDSTTLAKPSHLTISNSHLSAVSTLPALCLPTSPIHPTIDRISKQKVANGPAVRALVPLGRSGCRPLVSAKAEGDDFATRIAKFVFGEKVLEDMEPAGLKRMTVDEWPDQWPPVVGEYAAAVEGDTPEVAAFRPLLKQTKLEKRTMSLIYDADQDGWSESAFHKKVDGMGACVLVGETDEGTVFGAYNPIGWLGYGDWRDAISAFLFSWPTGKGIGKGEAASKLPKCGGSGMAIIDEPGKGPQWGPDGLKLALAARKGASRLGPYYERMPGGGRSIFGDEGNKAGLKMVRVYTGVGQSDKEKNYQPNALQWQPGELERIRERDGEKR